MNKEWSDLNKKMQNQLKKKDTFHQGLNSLFLLREELMQTLLSLGEELSCEELCAMPFINASGYHSKTIAYSLWHIFRIEDIVAHSLIAGDEQILFTGDHLVGIGSPIITTGNELTGYQIAEFSKNLDIGQLYSYITEVKESTEKILRGLTFEDMKKKVSHERREVLQDSGSVSNDENAAWLIDYWCGKDIRGLIQMPFSRHWIMHIEASLRIRNKLRS